MVAHIDVGPLEHSGQGRPRDCQNVRRLSQLERQAAKLRGGPTDLGYDRVFFIRRRKLEKTSVLPAAMRDRGRLGVQDAGIVADVGQRRFVVAVAAHI